MKFTKMSLVAALLVGSSAFAIDNVKVSGDAKLYYSTDDVDTATNANPGSGAAGQGDLFDKYNSAAQATASLSISADLTDGISAGTKVTAYTTLGLEGQLVSNVWEQGITDGYIVNDLWLATTVGKTTAKIGRMELDTPLVFTEKWSIIENTFEAAVLINQDIPDTTLIAAYVGGSNSQAVNGGGAGAGSVTTVQGNGSSFSQFYGGAYAVAAINNSWKPLTAQAWYFNAAADEVLDPVTPANKLTGTDAYWLQADLNFEGILAGAQYAGETFNTNFAGDIDTSVYAVMIGYEMKDMFTAKIAYSAVDKDHGMGGNLAGSGQSKLYTEAWWNYGRITQADTSAYNLTVEVPVEDIADFGLYYTYADQDLGQADDTGDLAEITLTASKSFGPLDTSLVYINATLDNDDASNTIQAYLTYNF